MRKTAIARAGRPGLRTTGGAKVPAAPAIPARKRMSPDRSSTTLSAIPLPVKSARNGVSASPTPLPAGAGTKVPSPLPSSTPIALSWLLAATRSGRPSPLTSATTAQHGLKVGGERLLVQERTVAVVQKDAHGVTAVVGGDDVELAVAGQVGRRHRVGPRADREGLLPAGTSRCRCPRARSPCCRRHWP